MSQLAVSSALKMGVRAEGHLQEGKTLGFPWISIEFRADRRISMGFQAPGRSVSGGH